MRALTTDMRRDELRPYFLWDEDVSIAELRAILAGPASHERDRLLGKMLREARDLDVWHFVRNQQATPAGIARTSSTSRSTDVSRDQGRRSPQEMLGREHRSVMNSFV